MKKLFTLSAFLFSGLLAFPVIHLVQVSNFQFTPQTVQAQCQDTVRWIWSSGTHNTNSTTIPGCASPWNAPIDMNNTMYQIQIPCAGTYNYNCTIHPNMTGIIVATCTTGEQEILNPSTVNVFPNPFQEQFSVELSGINELAVFNVLGEEVKRIRTSGITGILRIDTYGLLPGVYFLATFRNNEILETRRIVKSK
jgi:hypothetical protein